MNRRGMVVIVVLVFAFQLVGGFTPRVSVSQAQSHTKQIKIEDPFVPGRVLVKFRSGMGAVRSHEIIAEAGARDDSEIPGIGVHIVELPASTDEKAFVQALSSRSEVEFAELDRLFAPEAITPNDPSYPSEWHLPKISGPTAWSTTTGSSSVTIAILDTGCDPTHPDLSSKYVPGWNFYDNNSDTHDVYGHGTGVAGTAAAFSNNGSGVASVAWNCKIMPIRISDLNGYGSISAMANGLTWAADLGVRVANISYRVTTSPTVTSAAQYFQSRGGIVTIAAGNETIFDSTADNPYVLTVSATTSSDTLASWSNTGNNIDLSAPGVNILTTLNGGGYGLWSGTSFSAPIVAGVAALVLSTNPSLTPTQVQDILKQSANDLGAAGWDTSYGWGRVNAANAVAMAQTPPPPPPPVTDTTPPTVSITSPSDSSTVSGTVSIATTASDNVGVASVSLKVDGSLFGTATATPYTFSWNTTTMSNGTHTLTVTASDAAGNTASASVTVTVYNAGDTTPPVVNITSPTNGSTASGNVSIQVNVADNIGVVRVDLYVDGVLIANSTTAPFTTKWNARRAASGAHTLQCKAYDAAGNVGTSAIVTVYK